MTPFKKILIVEDNPGDAFLIQEIMTKLNPNGYDIRHVIRLNDCFPILEQDGADLVLLDLNLPDSKGLATVHSFRSRAPHVAVVVLTGDQDEALGLAAVQAGAQDFLVKGQIPGGLLIRVINYAIERQQADLRLRESERFLRATLDALSSHIAIIDEQGTILAVNKAWKKFAKDNGIDVSTVCEGANYLQACDLSMNGNSHDVQAFLDGIQSVREGQVDHFGFEYPCHSPNENRWFYCRITPFPKPGKPCVVIAHENISRRKMAEENLRNSELKLRTILDAQTNQIIFLDLKHRIIWANQAACAYLGCDRDKLNEVTCFAYKKEKNEPCENCPVIEAVKKGKPVVSIMETPDGKTWNVMGCPVKNQHNQTISVVEVREDITEKLAIEDQFRQAQKMDAVGRLAGGVAHDFNNMLSIITGFGELARDQVSPQSPIAESLDEILSAARRSADLTRHLLAFARKQVIAPQIINCNDIIASSEKILKRLVGEDITIRFIPGQDLWLVKIDPSQIDQIMTNLAVNARDAIKHIGNISMETRNVMITDDYSFHKVYAKPGPYVLITFSDDGTGMDQQTKSQIFEPFYTTKEKGKGTGLGLATIFGIVKQNNGFVNVYSEIGHGCTFNVYIPCYQGDVPTEKPEEKIIPSPGTEYILVVEDEASVLKLCIHILKECGYHVVGAPSPEAALTYLATTSDPIDLLISDVVMPGMGGKELKAEIEKMKPGIKTLFMSGYTYDAITHRGILPDDLNFIHKPFSKTALANKVRHVLDH